MTNQHTEPITTTSADINEERLAQLRQLFPEAFTEGKVDFDKLRATLGDLVDDRPERYSFTWAGKQDAIRILQTPTSATLIPAPDESVDFNNTQNIFIEGDNLEVLKLLYKAYFGRVKMIYIDPPYNTGNDFIYPDNYADPLDTYLQLTGQKDTEGNLLATNSDTSGRYHSAWLTMMYSRLFLARQLLRDDGVIFISIDDRELYNLHMLMNEVFGEENFIGLFIINSSPSAIDYGHIGKMHDYALFFAKNIDEAVTYQLPEKNKKFKFTDEIGPFNLYPLYNGNVAFNPDTRPNLYYPFYLNPDSKIAEDFYEIGLDKKPGWVEVYPVISKKDGIPRVWRWGKAKSRKQLNKEIVGYKTESGEFRVVQKTRHTGKVIRSLQIDKDISTRRGTRQVEELFGSKLFPFPKSVELIKRFVNVSTQDDDIVLDFFAGSGTTAQAVIELNAEDDDSNRRFICVQLPEPTENESFPTIAEIAKERIRRVIQQMQAEDEGKLPLQTRDTPEDLGFKVFKLASTNFRSWEGTAEATPEEFASQMELFTDPLVDGWSAPNVIYEIALKEGYSLNCYIQRTAVAGHEVYRINDQEKDQHFYLCLENAITENLPAKLSLTPDDLFVCRDIALNDTMAANLALQCRLKTI